MKNFLIIFLFVLTSSVVKAGDFRNVNWGMNVKEVLKSESTPPTADKGEGARHLLLFDSKVASMDCSIAYIFVNDTLVRAKYMFNEKHSNKNDYIDDYKKINKILEKKYSTPSSDETIWKNDLYKDRYQDYGLAVSIGHLLLYKSWKTESTEIISIISGDNYTISSGVEYTSIKYNDRERIAKEKQTAEEF